MRARVTVVGLGPGGPDLVTAGTLEALAVERPRFVRTRRHPAASILVDAHSFDDVYDRAPTIEAVYAEIVDRVVDAAVATGDVLYAVPGSPVVAERTVELLAGRDEVDLEVVPAMSFLDLAWSRLGVDPIASGVRVVDGHRFAVEAAGERGPLLVCQCDHPEVLSDIKLAVPAEAFDEPDASVTVLQRLGLPDEAIFTVSWQDLDRSFEPDHLTSVFVADLASPVAAELVRFADLVTTLREQCPWDRQQTHQSLRPYLTEEAHEVLEAIDHLDPDEPDSIDHLAEELGDLLLQVYFHSTIARQEGWFDLGDVARGVHDKLHARHPHVFGDVTVAGADEVVTNWEAIKAAEKGRESALDGIPAGLPALARAQKVQKRADRAGLGASPAAPRDDAERFADRLLSLVADARAAGIDAEDALRRRVVQLDEALRSIE
ncbi:MAG TPA: MazG family protein [Microthrixaceae bacterium]|nr:MazG family protein [Microthrixaceae bacterium]